MSERINDFYPVTGEFRRALMHFAGQDPKIASSPAYRLLHARLLEEQQREATDGIAKETPQNVLQAARDLAEDTPSLVFVP